MPWKECDRMSERGEFCRLASVEGANFKLLCERFGIARKTGYKWLKRFRADGVEGLAERSRRPKRLPAATAASVEAQVLAVRDLHPAWGGRKIRARLERLGEPAVPAASTITAILRRHDRLPPAESTPPRAYQRFERPHPNDLWQMDFKGEFRLTPGDWCHPLTMLDDHSRYSLVLAACGDEQRLTVEQQLQAAFRRYGLPRAMLMDNGPPWGAPMSPGGPTRLSVWLMDLDIKVLHGRPYHPQTQGKDERFHRTLKLEVLQGRTFHSLKHVQRHFDSWREVYNCERPHEALGQAVPSSRYRVSERSYEERIAAFEYDPSFEVRRVDREGRIAYQGCEHYLSKAFATRWVGIRSTELDGQFAVYYRSFLVGKLVRANGKPHRLGAGSARSARQTRPQADP